MDFIHTQRHQVPNEHTSCRGFADTIHCPGSTRQVLCNLKPIHRKISSVCRGLPRMYVVMTLFHFSYREIGIRYAPHPFLPRFGTGRTNCHNGTGL